MTATAAGEGSTEVEGGRGPAASELAALGPGDSIGRFQITGVLGAGGMGRVYRARDPELNREVAIKVLRRAAAADTLAPRLLREAQAMARLQHVNLATVFDVGTVRGEVFLAFELVDGPTLARWMREPGRTLADKLAALEAAGRGLAAAHSAGVIHRDFKPDNVLVARDGTVKVVDFGLARGVDESPPLARDRHDALASNLTVTGSILGTPAYMAPEQHQGGVTDARADQFGFAVSAWECLYGERPFRGGSLESLALAICDGAIAPPPPGHGVPAGIEPVLRRALAVAPADRFPDLPALLDALTAAARSPRRRRRWPLAVAGALALAGAAGLWIASRDRPRARTVGAGLRDEQVREVVKTNIAATMGCYEQALVDDPTLGPGTVTIRFGIAPDGRVTSTRIDADAFDGAQGIAACIAAQSLRWRFPPPAGGVATEVAYPFEFAPTPLHVTRVDDTTFELDPATLARLRGEPGLLTRGVRPMPTDADGKPLGWKLYAIAPGSAAARLGFENGDTVTHLAGRSLAGNAATMDAVQALSVAPTPATLEVRLRRRGVERVHTYRIAR